MPLIESSLWELPQWLIVDLIHLVELEIRCLRRQWLANSTGFTTSHLRYRWKAEIKGFMVVYWLPRLDPSFVVGRLFKDG